MKRHHQLVLTGLVVGALLIAACGKNEPASTSTPAAAVPAPASTPAAPAPVLPPRAAQLLTQTAWLRERLPEHTIAYLRIPSVWGLLSAPSGRPLDPALASEPHARIVAALREAVRKDKTLADTGLAPALTLLLGDLDAPLEIVAIDNGDMLNPASTLALFSTRLDIASVGELNARLAALGEGAPLLKAPLDPEGRGVLLSGGFARFDPASRRVYGLIGVTATPALLDQWIEQLKQPRVHRLHDIERRIDSSGQGLFGWISLKGLTGIASTQVPNEPGAALVRDLLDQTQSLAFGWGTVDGHGRLQVRLEAPRAKLLGYLAARQYRADLKAAGKPRWAISLMLPDAERLTTFEASLTADFGAETARDYRAGVALLQQRYGIAPVEWLKLIGPELIGFEDANGRYTALRVNDWPALYRKLDELGQRFHWRRETLKVGKAEVQHLTIPGAIGMEQDDAPNDDTGEDAAFQALLARLNTHLYWIENGSWLVFGEVPQALADRAAGNLDTDLGQWLKQSKGYAPEHALLGVSAVTRNAQREVYYAYLGGLQLLGDLVGATISLADMPSASALQLPVEGAIGLALEVTPDRFGFSVDYEQTPVEVLMAGDGGALLGVAVAGIVAAIAIPAYQDYTVRAQVASVLAESDPLKQAMAEYYFKNKRLPRSSEDLRLGFEGDSLKYLEGYGIDGGAVVLVFGDEADAALKERTLLLTPYLGIDGRLLWVCGNANPPAGVKPLASAVESASDIPDQYLPKACR